MDIKKPGIPYTGNMERSIVWRFPVLILGIMFALMLGASLGDAAIMDELAHIPAGYSYVKFLDYRLNPEHPPLVKALAGVPLLFLDLNYPTDDKTWTDEVNGQWVQGAKFLYESGNDPEEILFWSRLPMMGLTILLGALFYLWTKHRFGRWTANLALIFFAFSPTFIAHGHYVTTDIGASLGFFIGIISFLNFLENPSWKNTLIAGLGLGTALLLKFSTFLLLPVDFFLLILFLVSRTNLDWRAVHRLAHRLLGKTIIAGGIAIILVSAVYGIFTLHYPPERQISDTVFNLSSYRVKAAVQADLWLARHALTRPFAQYLLGVLMVSQRAAGGNTAYFLGEVSNSGSRLYFPLMYLVKEPLAFHLLSVIALALGFAAVAKSRWGVSRVRAWAREHFAIFSAGFFILFYWLYSMSTPLNIGVRHVLPTFPFLYLLVAEGLKGWIRPAVPQPGNLMQLLTTLYRRYLLPLPRQLVVFLLLVWLVLGTLLTYPYFLSYHNELAGGTFGGYRVAVDSNYDWGQDLKRLREYMNRHRIDRISLDYFGGGSPRYYLGNGYEPWWSARGPAHGYFAVSATFLQGAINPTAPGFFRKEEDSYEWLRGASPSARAGTSIFIYQLP